MAVENMYIEEETKLKLNRIIDKFKYNFTDDAIDIINEDLPYIPVSNQSLVSVEQSDQLINNRKYSHARFKVIKCIFFNIYKVYVINTLSNETSEFIVFNKSKICIDYILRRYNVEVEQINQMQELRKFKTKHIFKERQKQRKRRQQYLPNVA